jgi:hypothetical protein
LSKRGLNASAEGGTDYQLRIGDESDEEAQQVISCPQPSNALAALISSTSDECLESKHISWSALYVMLLTDVDVTSRRKAIIAVTHLCEQDEYHEIIQEVGGVSLLMKRLSDSNEDIVRYASNALKNLAANNVNRQMMQDAGLYF